MRSYLLINQVVKFIEVATIRKDDVTKLEQVRNQLYCSVTSAALLVADQPYAFTDRKLLEQQYPTCIGKNDMADKQ